MVDVTSVPGRGCKQQCLCCWNRTDLGKCTHQDDEKQGNNNTHMLLTKDLFFRCKKIITKRSRNFLSFLFFTSFFFFIYFSSCTQRRQFLLKALMYYCFLVFPCIGEYISLDLFCFVNLTSSCSLTPGFWSSEGL